MKAIKILAAALTTVSVSTAAFAASSATLILQGTIGAVNDITVAANGSNNTTLNIASGETAKNVGTATETSNNILGYKITISSPTDGQLRNQTDSTLFTTYKVAYNGAAAVTPTVAGVVVKNVAALTALTTATSAIAVDVVALPNGAAGTYMDTLTVSIQAN